MISPLRKANDSSISLTTPWIQTYVSLANRKRRKRQFDFISTNERTNEPYVQNVQKGTNAWQYVRLLFFVLCNDDLYALCGTASERR